MVGLRPFMRRRCCLPSAEQPSSAPGRCKNADTHSGICVFGAAGQIRTADLILTKDALYLLSYSSEKTCPFFKGHVATKKGLEPSTSGVTGRRSNQLNYLATARLYYQIHFRLSTLFLCTLSFFRERVFPAPHMPPPLCRLRRAPGRAEHVVDPDRKAPARVVDEHMRHRMMATPWGAADTGQSTRSRPLPGSIRSCKGWSSRARCAPVRSCRRSLQGGSLSAE